MVDSLRGIDYLILCLPNTKTRHIVMDIARDHCLSSVDDFESLTFSDIRKYRNVGSQMLREIAGVLETVFNVKMKSNSEQPSVMDIPSADRGSWAAWTKREIELMTLLLNNPNSTYGEIAVQMGVTRSRVYNIRDSCLYKLEFFQNFANLLGNKKEKP